MSQNTFQWIVVLLLAVAIGLVTKQDLLFLAVCYLAIAAVICLFKYLETLCDWSDRVERVKRDRIERAWWADGPDARPGTSACMSES
jgi:hypothetical protein